MLPVLFRTGYGPLNWADHKFTAEDGEEVEEEQTVRLVHWEEGSGCRRNDSSPRRLQGAKVWGASFCFV
jgi:hypothetical protein